MTRGISMTHRSPFYKNEPEASLVGKKIVKILINKERDVILMGTSDGAYRFVAEGDCCSEAWFNHIAGISALIGGTVITDGTTARLHDNQGTRQEYDDFFFWNMSTDLGYATIEIRNSSNGYYNGDVVCSFIDWADIIEAPHGFEDLLRDF